MTPDILDHLSGNVPFGLSFLPIFGGIFTFVWWATWKGTGFWGQAKFWRIFGIGWAILLSGYTMYWRFHRPAPIPTRVFVHAGELAEKNPGPWAEGIANVIKARLIAAPERFVVQDEEVAGVLFKIEDQTYLDSIAWRLRIKYQVSVVQDSAAEGEMSPVKVTVRKWSGGKYINTSEFATPNIGLAAAAVWAGEAVALKLGGVDLKGRWVGRPPNLSDSVLTVHYLAWSLRRMNENELAAAYFSEEAAENDSWSDPRIEFARTWLYSSPDMHEDEIHTALLEAASIDKANPETYLLLGKHFLEFRDWDEAESALKLAYNYNPDDPRVYFYLSRLMDNRLADFPLKNSRALVERALQLAPGYEAARLSLIEKMRSIDQRRQATKIITDGLSINPHSHALLVTASAIYLEMRQYDKASAYCQAMLDDNPRDHEALYNLGLCKLWVKEYDASVALFDSSRRNGGTVENLYYAGVANQLKGDYPAAIQWFQKRFAAAQAQDDQGAASSRARIEMLRNWILEDSMKAAGWKPSNPFERTPKVKDMMKGIP